MILAQAFLKQLAAGQVKIPSVILIYGEEPLHIRQSLDEFRNYLKQQDYLQRDQYLVDASFDWQGLEMETRAGSLFANKRLIELNIPKGAPGKNGGDFIQQWANAPAVLEPEICLIITCEKIEAKTIKTKWFKAVESVGIVVQSRPILLQDLPRWCQARAEQVGLSLDQEAAGLLAERVEGNLLAADQEIEKLSLLFTQGTQLVGKDIIEKVADQAHYQLFALSTAALTGKTAYGLQILKRLRQEGLEAPIILWLLAKEVRTIIQIIEKQSEQAIGQIYKSLRIWNSKQSEYNKALKRQNLQGWQECLALCMQTDFEIKGIQKGDAWLSLSQLVVKISS